MNWFNPPEKRRDYRVVLWNLRKEERENEWQWQMTDTSYVDPISAVAATPHYGLYIHDTYIYIYTHTTYHRRRQFTDERISLPSLVRLINESFYSINFLEHHNFNFKPKKEICFIWLWRWARTRSHWQAAYGY